jgi:hypothetical protein
MEHTLCSALLVYRRAWAGGADYITMENRALAAEHILGAGGMQGIFGPALFRVPAVYLRTAAMSHHTSTIKPCLHYSGLTLVNDWACDASRPRQSHFANDGADAKCCTYLEGLLASASEEGCSIRLTIGNLQRHA